MRERERNGNTEKERDSKKAYTHGRKRERGTEIEREAGRKNGR